MGRYDRLGLLENKVALITGASAGIGRETALLMADEGASLILNARRAEPLEAIRQEIEAAGGTAFAVAGDVADPATHAALAEAAETRFGGLDIAVNNAAVIGPYKPLAEVTLEEWQHTLAANLTAAFLGARAQVPLMLRRGGGSLLFTSTFVGTSVAIPGMGAYGTSKAALGGLVKALTADYAAQGIRANAVLPGGVDTDLGGSEEQKAWAATLHAMKRIAKPREIAEAMLFLASDRASFITGASLFVDGGNAAVKLG